MISRLRLVRYKGFKEFTLNLKGSAILVGPNNAGKTTIISALRLCAYLIRQARSRQPEHSVHDSVRDRSVVGYVLSLPAEQFVQENVHYEFREEEARVELRFKDGASLYVVWPVDDDPYFYLEHLDGMQPRTISTVKEKYPLIGIVPTLAPVDHREFVRSEKHVRENLSTRLVSRHFRNQVYFEHYKHPSAYEEFVKFAVENTPEIEYLELVSSSSGSEREIDLYYCESVSHTEKELYWAGDGLQIWLQFLFHVWRQKEVQTLVLDEPDIFLHPDLQRRLVRVLEGINSQVIMATHAPEILSEASRDSVIIVDRSKKISRRISDDRALGVLNDALGSGFNLRLAKTLRSRVALFVEGKDMKVLRNIASTLGASNFSKERGLAVVPMDGYSNRGMSSSFGWLNSNFLDGAVEVFVILDRDYRSDSQVSADLADLQQAGIRAHVWKRKELESYLLVPPVIARASGLDVGQIQEYMNASEESLRDKVFARYLATRSVEERSSGVNQVTINEESIKEFDVKWKDRSWRLSIVPPKDVLSSMNQRIQSVGGKPVSMRGLSAKIRVTEIDDEMRNLIFDVEASLTSGSID
jgi:energy-coupling factor transporter ATP-binding protein EcfA2